MSEKTEEKEQVEKVRIMPHAIGNYSIQYKEKNYSFLFPVKNTLEENLYVIDKLKEVLSTSIEEQNKKNKESK